MSRNRRGKVHGPRKGKEYRTTETARFYTSKNWVECRQQIFERDNFTCILCDKRGGDLACHHVTIRAHLPKEQWTDINNLVTLCSPCHNKTKGKEYFYKPQLLKILLESS